MESKGRNVGEEGYSVWTKEKKDKKGWQEEEIKKGEKDGKGIGKEKRV